MSLLELLAALREVVPDWTAAPVLAPARAGEVARSVLDASRARVELGWTARTTLVDGLRSTYAAIAAQAPQTGPTSVAVTVSAASGPSSQRTS